MDKFGDDGTYDIEIYGVRYYYVAGYTGGGAPYGITWEEAEELDLLDEEEIKAEEDNDRLLLKQLMERSKEAHKDIDDADLPF